MTARASVVAPSNIALIKYWGTRDEDEVMPYNPSLSITLSRCVTTTTVQVLPAEARDEVLLVSDVGEPRRPERHFESGVSRHLDRVRLRCRSDARFRVATKNSFPMGAGIASSASGYAALTLATVAALDVPMTVSETSVLARRSGSGSAARSVLGGYVEWPIDEEGGAGQIAPADHWDLRDVIAIVDDQEKAVSSLEGHRRAPTSPYYERRLEQLPDRLARARRAIQDRHFATLAPLVEEEAIDLHLIAMSSNPPIFYWRPATLRVLEAIRDARAAGVEVCATMDAGANVHAICTAGSEPDVVTLLESISGVDRLIADGVGTGPYVTEEHLL